MNYWQNFSSLEKIFLDSQYVNKNPPGWIPDETAFSYAGGKLIKGENPVLVVPDAPPLGKYIIGLSTIIFNNDSTFILVGALLSLILLYILSFQIFANKILSIIPSLLLSFEPIFKNQLIYTPLMDIFQLFFLLCIFIFFNKGISNEKSFLYFFLGFFIATKFFITGFPIIVAYYIVLFFVKDKKKIINLTLTLPLALFILLLSYARVFAFGYTINKFLGIQKWVYLYHKSYLILPLSVWPLLLLNKWHVWFGDKPIIQDAQWSFTWPIITIASIITIILYILGKIPKNKNLEILMAWFVVYMLFLSVGQIFSRYFVILIPILYVISLYGVISIYKIYKK
ncbi:MAG: glycosyltransferase family 39 protein [Candidatus Pacearchaeota archaeon]